MVHTYQMCILMMFNTADTYTYQQIQEVTQIPDAVCAYVIESRSVVNQLLIRSSCLC